MKNPYIAKTSIVINAPVSKVWDALINPEIIKQYLFGTTAVSEWKVGSPITYKGVWEGKTYEDKGTILKLEPEKILSATYWSSMSGIPDLPENYNTVTYELSVVGDQTTLSISQDNIATTEARDHSVQNWNSVLKGLKELLEK